MPPRKNAGVSKKQKAQEVPDDPIEGLEEETVPPPQTAAASSATLQNDPPHHDSDNDLDPDRNEDGESVYQEPAPLSIEATDRLLRRKDVMVMGNDIMTPLRYIREPDNKEMEAHFTTHYRVEDDDDPELWSKQAVPLEEWQHQMFVSRADAEDAIKNRILTKDHREPPTNEPPLDDPKFQKDLWNLALDVFRWWETKAMLRCDCFIDYSPWQGGEIKELLEEKIGLWLMKFEIKGLKGMQSRTPLSERQDILTVQENVIDEERKEFYRFWEATCKKDLGWEVMPKWQFKMYAKAFEGTLKDEDGSEYDFVEDEHNMSIIRNMKFMLLPMFPPLAERKGDWPSTREVVFKAAEGIITGKLPATLGEESQDNEDFGAAVHEAARRQMNEVTYNGRLFPKYRDPSYPGPVISNQQLLVEELAKDHQSWLRGRLEEEESIEIVRPRVVPFDPPMDDDAEGENAGETEAGEGSHNASGFP